MEVIYMWFIFALLSAVFAALTSILAKVGIEGVNSNLATAIRTVVVVVMAWVMVFLTHTQNGISGISRKSWIFLILSGLATGASWLCYYRALQLGEASKVVPVDKLSVVITLALAFLFLHEEFTVKSLLGCILISAGTIVMVV
jgi:transporter family protein